MSVLITGGTGFIGSHLARRLVKEGRKVVLFDVAPNYRRIDDIKDAVKVVRGDLALWSNVLDAVRENEVTEIFHLGAVLSAASEANPTASFKANVEGTFNVLEAARLFGAKKVLFPSSYATYGPGFSNPVGEDERQEPRTAYGVSKVFGELWGLYYCHRYGIDFRALRFTSIVGPGSGVGAASAYASLIIQKAALGEAYEVNVDEGARIPIIYYKDAVNALIFLYKAKDLKHRVYNIGGITPTAQEIVDTVKKHVPNAVIRFAPQPEIVAVIRSWPPNLDDRRARKELDWKPSYPLEELVKDFIGEVQNKRFLFE
ncbi:MAG: NAD-dependent epimerase/dehydratase family protein [Candidatus Bathyarchaeia archaeon]